MLLENYLRHIKLAEFNPSVILASWLGLFLLLLVTFATAFPFVATQKQSGGRIPTLFTGSHRTSYVALESSESNYGLSNLQLLINNIYPGQYQEQRENPSLSGNLNKRIIPNLDTVSYHSNLLFYPSN